MSVGEQIIFTEDDFVSSNWREALSSSGSHGYSSVSQALSKLSEFYKDSDENLKSQMMLLLERACSMMINAKSINEPFTPVFQNLRTGSRSAIPGSVKNFSLLF